LIEASCIVGDTLDNQKRDQLMETSEHRARHLHRNVGGGRRIFVVHFAFLSLTLASPFSAMNSTPKSSSAPPD
jgi:hypothetical protein